MKATSLLRHLSFVLVFLSFALSCTFNPNDSKAQAVPTLQLDSVLTAQCLRLQTAGTQPIGLANQDYLGRRPPASLYFAYFQATDRCARKPDLTPAQRQETMSLIDLYLTAVSTRYVIPTSTGDTVSSGIQIYAVVGERRNELEAAVCNSEYVNFYGHIPSTTGPSYDPEEAYVLIQEPDGRQYLYRWAETIGGKGSVRIRAQSWTASIIGFSGSRAFFKRQQMQRSDLTSTQPGKACDAHMILQPK